MWQLANTVKAAEAAEDEHTPAQETTWRLTLFA